MKWIIRSIAICFGLMLVSSSCDNEPSKQPRIYTKEELLDVNRKMMTDESARIDTYIARRGWEMTETTTGLRYEIYHHGGGAMPTTTMLATITYTAYLLDNTIVRSADLTDPK